MGTEYCNLCGCCGGGVMLDAECDTVPICTKCISRLRKIEAAARWLVLIDREYNRIAICGLDYKSDRYGDDFLTALSDAYDDAKSDLERLLGEING